jgi:hypothetical protein
MVEQLRKGQRSSKFEMAATHTLHLGCRKFNSLLTFPTVTSDGKIRPTSRECVQSNADPKGGELSLERHAINHHGKLRYALSLSPRF